MKPAQATHYLNDRWVADDQLLISGHDLGLIRGYGAFDWLRTYSGRPFMAQEHVDRLFKSAASVGLKPPVKPGELLDLIDQGLAKNGDGEWGIRLVVTGGPSRNGLALETDPTLLIIFNPAQRPDPKIYQQGTRLISQIHQRFKPQTKSLDYTAAVMAKQLAIKAGVDGVVYISGDGHLLECPTSNLFVVADGCVKTAADNVLLGITRQLVIDICQQNDIPCQPTALTTSPIDQYQEMFITSSNTEIQPVVELDQTPIGDGKVGPLTRRLMDLYRQKIRGETS